MNRLELLEFYLSANLFESLLQVLSFVLRKTFLYNAGSSVNEVLSFLQTETARLLNSLDDLQLVCTCGLEDNVEVSLLFLGGTLSGGTSNYDCSSSGFDTIFILQDSSEFVNFLNCEVNQFFSKSF